MDNGLHWRWRNIPLPGPHLSLIAGGLILHCVRPWRLLAKGCLRLMTGWSFIVAGAVLAGWATGAARNVDLARSDRPVTTGPYAVSRHPMYIGWTGIYLGVALVVNTRWLLILSPLLLAFVHRTVLTEERQLEKCLGGDYRAYKKRVRRYL